MLKVQCKYISQGIKAGSIYKEVVYETGWLLFNRCQKQLAPKMHFFTKTSLLVLLLAITQVQALICYETIVDAKTQSFTVIEKETSSEYCQIIDCEWADFFAEGPCSKDVPTSVNTTVRLKFLHRQRSVSQCEKPSDLFLPYLCCNSNYCNSVENIKQRASETEQDSVLIGLVSGDLIITCIAIVFGSYFYSNHLKSKSLKAIKGLKIFNLFTSLFVLILLCVAKLPFGGSAPFIVLFIASIVSILSHGFDLATKSIQQTKRHIGTEIIIILLYIMGLSMIFDQMMPIGYVRVRNCRWFPSGMPPTYGEVSPDRDICACINTIIVFSELFSFNYLK